MSRRHQQPACQLRSPLPNSLQQFGSRASSCPRLCKAPRCLIQRGSDDVVGGTRIRICPTILRTLCHTRDSADKGKQVRRCPTRLLLFVRSLVHRLEADASLLRLLQPHWLGGFRNNSGKPRIAAQIVPLRVESQTSGLRASRQFHNRLQQLDRLVMFAIP